MIENTSFKYKIIRNMNVNLKVIFRSENLEISCKLKYYRTTYLSNTTLNLNIRQIQQHKIFFHIDEIS